MQEQEAPDPELASKLAALRWSKASARPQQGLALAHGPRATAEAAQQAAEASADEPSKLQSSVQSQLESQCTSAELEAHSLREQLKNAQAELAMEGARAGQQAQEAEAALRRHIAALEKVRFQAKAAAHDELVACRDAGMKVSPFISTSGMVYTSCQFEDARLLACCMRTSGRGSPDVQAAMQAVAELEAQVARLSKDKAAQQQALQRLESEVARLREGIIKNRV